MGERIGGAKCEEPGKKIGFTQIPQIKFHADSADNAD